MTKSLSNLAVSVTPRLETTLRYDYRLDQCFALEAYTYQTIALYDYKWHNAWLRQKHIASYRYPPVDNEHCMELGYRTADDVK